MTPTLARYVQRSPRYILQADDNTLIRLAGPQQLPWEEGTEIMNLSLTGLAFLAPRDLAPMVGEVVRIQFEVPGASQMAAFSQVIRVEEHGQSNSYVGVKFVKMDFAQRMYLTQALSERLQMPTEFHRPKVSKKALRSLLAAGLMLIVWMMTLWVWMSGAWVHLL